MRRLWEDRGPARELDVVGVGQSSIDHVGLVEGSYTRLNASYHSDHHPIRVEIRFGR